MFCMKVEQTWGPGFQFSAVYQAPLCWTAFWIPHNHCVPLQPSPQPHAPQISLTFPLHGLGNLLSLTTFLVGIRFSSYKALLPLRFQGLVHHCQQVTEVWAELYQFVSARLCCGLVPWCLPALLVFFTSFLGLAADLGLFTSLFHMPRTPVLCFYHKPLEQ